MNGEIGVGNIYNYYGGLVVKEEDGKYYWGIWDHNDKVNDWEEISCNLFLELLEHNRRQQQQQQHEKEN